MEGQVQAFSRNLEGQELSGLDSYEEKSKTIWIYAHTLMYTSLRSKVTCTCNFLPQTHIHRDVCISPNIFGVFLIWVQMTWLFSFPMSRYRSDLTLHYPFGVLYKEPLGYIEEEELKSNITIVHCCLILLVLESTSLCPFGEHSVLPKLSFSLWACYQEMEDCVIFSTLS